jgi:hypothetical protein
MNTLKRAWAAWVAMLSRQETGEAFAFFRVAIGLITISTLVDALAADAWRVVWVDQLYGGYRGFGPGTPLVNFFGGPTPAVIHGMVWASLIACTLVVVGLGGRVSAFIALQTFIALHRMNSEASGSSDELITNGLWLLVLGNGSATFSLDALLKTKSWRSERLISSWPRYLGVLQIMVTYTTTGLQKISVYWLPFGELSAVYYVLQQPSFIRFVPTYVPMFFRVTQLMTLVTWVWEVLTPLLAVYYWCRETPERGGRLRRLFAWLDLRLVWALIGSGFHVGIWVTMEVGPFSPIAMAYYLCFWHPDELKRAAAWVRARSTTTRPSKT